MVGSVVGVFTAIEAKTDTGRPTQEQIRFIDHVKKNGGIAIIAREEEDIDRLEEMYDIRRA
jgi:hypothetical protein